MNINTAINKANQLAEEIERCQRFLSENMEKSARVHVITSQIRDIPITAQIGEEGLRKIFADKIREMAAEHAKLKAVIDMANAALKGMNL